MKMCRKEIGIKKKKKLEGDTIKMQVTAIILILRVYNQGFGT